MADFHQDEEEITMLQPDVLREKWRHDQIQRQKYMCSVIDSTWRKKQVVGSTEQSAFSELVLGLSECSGVDDDFKTDFGISDFVFSEGAPRCSEEQLACDSDKSESIPMVPSSLKSIPCLSGWLSKKKESSFAFMTPFSRWRKSWFVVVMHPDSLILNRYDGDMFSTPTKATIFDLGHKASREQGLDGCGRFCFSVAMVGVKARIVLAGDSKAQTENWVATLNSVMTEMRAERT